MTNDIEKVKAYAEELERIIEAADIRPHQRIIIDALIDCAKDKYDMYN